MGSETETTEQPVEESKGIPPAAFERQKAKAAEAEALANSAKEALAHALLVDKIQEHWESQPPEARPANPRQQAQWLAKQIPAGTENIAEAVAEFTAQSAALLPQAPPAPPPPPMAGGGTGPAPGASGADALDSGPIPMSDPKFLEYVNEKGMAAARQAIADGRFVPSKENADAQATIGLH